jgi:hypothetical protein
LTGAASTRYVSLAHQRAGSASGPGRLATEDGIMALKERGRGHRNRRYIVAIGRQAGATKSGANVLVKHDD